MTTSTNVTGSVSGSSAALVHSPTKLTLFRGMPIAKLAESVTVPANIPCTPEEWTGMSIEERQEYLGWYAQEEATITEGITVRFPRIKHPTSGASFWEMRLADGSVKPLPALELVVLVKAECRVYYPEEAGDTITAGALPTCMSANMIKPDPESPQVQSEFCASCPHAKWGSGKDGEGQACKTRIRLYGLQVQDDTLDDFPSFVSLPPSALRPFSEYLVALAKERGRAPITLITKLGLIKTKSKSGRHEFSQVQISAGRRLTLVEQKFAKDKRDLYAEHMKWRGGKALLDDIAAETAEVGPQDDDVLGDAPAGGGDVPF